MSDPQVFTATEYTNALKERDVEIARAKARRAEEEVKADAERWQRYRAKVAREEEERVEQLQRDEATVTAMSQEQKAQHYAKQAHNLVDKAEQVTRAALRFPTRYTIALQDNRSEELRQANRSREAAEQRAGIPRMQAASAERCQKINDTCAAELRELDERRRAVQERRRRKIDAEEQHLAAEIEAAREKLEVTA